MRVKRSELVSGEAWSLSQPLDTSVNSSNMSQSSNVANLTSSQDQQRGLLRGMHSSDSSFSSALNDDNILETNFSHAEESNLLLDSETAIPDLTAVESESSVDRALSVPFDMCKSKKILVDSNNISLHTDFEASKQKRNVLNKKCRRRRSSTLRAVSRFFKRSVTNEGKESTKQPSAPIYIKKELSLSRTSGPIIHRNKIHSPTNCSNQQKRKCKLRRHKPIPWKGSFSVKSEPQDVDQEANSPAVCSSTPAQAPTRTSLLNSASSLKSPFQSVNAAQFTAVTSKQLTSLKAIKLRRNNNVSLKRITAAVSFHKEKDGATYPVANSSEAFQLCASVNTELKVTSKTGDGIEGTSVLPEKSIISSEDNDNLPSDDLGTLVNSEGFLTAIYHDLSQNITLKVCNAYPYISKMQTSKLFGFCGNVISVEDDAVEDESFTKPLLVTVHGTVAGGLAIKLLNSCSIYGQVLQIVPHSEHAAAALQTLPPELFTSDVLSQCLEAITNYCSEQQMEFVPPKPYQSVSQQAEHETKDSNSSSCYSEKKSFIDDEDWDTGDDLPAIDEPLAVTQATDSIPTMSTSKSKPTPVLTVKASELVCNKFVTTVVTNFPNAGEKIKAFSTLKSSNRRKSNKPTRSNRQKSIAESTSNLTSKKICKTEAKSNIQDGPKKSRLKNTSRDQNKSSVCMSSATAEINISPRTTRLRTRSMMKADSYVSDIAEKSSIQSREKENSYMKSVIADRIKLVLNTENKQSKTAKRAKGKKRVNERKVNISLAKASSNSKVATDSSDFLGFSESETFSHDCETILPDTRSQRNRRISKNISKNNTSNKVLSNSPKKITRSKDKSTGKAKRRKATVSKRTTRKNSSVSDDALVTNCVTTCGKVIDLEQTFGDVITSSDNVSTESSEQFVNYAVTNNAAMVDEDPPDVKPSVAELDELMKRTADKNVTMLENAERISDNSHLSSPLAATVQIKTEPADNYGTDLCFPGFDFVSVATDHGDSEDRKPYVEAIDVAFANSGTPVDSMKKSAATNNIVAAVSPSDTANKASFDRSINTENVLADSAPGSSTCNVPSTLPGVSLANCTLGSGTSDTSAELFDYTYTSLEAGDGVESGLDSTESHIDKMIDKTGGEALTDGLEETHIDLLAYKKKRCQLIRCDRASCSYFHDEYDEIRDYNLYRGVRCNHAYNANIFKWKRPSACALGKQCGFAHSQLEFLFHPTNYKRHLCVSITKGKTCMFKQNCGFRHCQNTISREEVSRKQEQFNQRRMKAADLFDSADICAQQSDSSLQISQPKISLLPLPTFVNCPTNTSIPPPLIGIPPPNLPPPLCPAALNIPPPPLPWIVPPPNLKSFKTKTTGVTQTNLSIHSSVSDSSTSLSNVPYKEISSDLCVENTFSARSDTLESKHCLEIDDHNQPPYKFMAMEIEGKAFPLNVAIKTEPVTDHDSQSMEKARESYALYKSNIVRSDECSEITFLDTKFAHNVFTDNVFGIQAKLKVVERLKLLSSFSKHFGVMGSMLCAMYEAACSILKVGGDPLTLFDSDHTTLLSLLLEKIPKMRESVSDSEQLDRVEFTLQVLLRQIEDSALEGIYLGLDIAAIARSTQGCNADEIAEFVRQVLEVAGKSQPTAEQLHSVGLAAAAKHFKMSASFSSTVNRRNPAVSVHKPLVSVKPFDRNYEHKKVASVAPSDVLPIQARFRDVAVEGGENEEASTPNSVPVVLRSVVSRLGQTTEPQNATLGHLRSIAGDIDYRRLQPNDLHSMPLVIADAFGPLLPSADETPTLNNVSDFDMRLSYSKHSLASSSNFSERRLNSDLNSPVREIHERSFDAQNPSNNVVVWESPSFRERRCVVDMDISPIHQKSPCISEVQTVHENDNSMLNETAVDNCELWRSASSHLSRPIPESIIDMPPMSSKHRAKLNKSESEVSSSDNFLVPCVSQMDERSKIAVHWDTEEQSWRQDRVNTSCVGINSNISSDKFKTYSTDTGDSTLEDSLMTCKRQDSYECTQDTMSKGTLSLNQIKSADQVNTIIHNDIDDRKRSLLSQSVNSDDSSTFTTPLLPKPNSCLVTRKSVEPNASHSSSEYQSAFLQFSMPPPPPRPKLSAVTPPVMTSSPLNNRLVNSASPKLDSHINLHLTSGQGQKQSPLKIGLACNSISNNTTAASTGSGISNLGNCDLQRDISNSDFTSNVSLEDRAVNPKIVTMPILLPSPNRKEWKPPETPLIVPPSPWQSLSLKRTEFDMSNVPQSPASRTPVHGGSGHLHEFLHSNSQLLYTNSSKTKVCEARKRASSFLQEEMVRSFKDVPVFVTKRKNDFDVDSESACKTDSNDCANSIPKQGCDVNFCAASCSTESDLDDKPPLSEGSESTNSNINCPPLSTDVCYSPDCNNSIEDSADKRDEADVETKDEETGLSLTFSDMLELLGNFTQLEPEEQIAFSTYLRNLKRKEPNTIEKLYTIAKSK